MITDILELRTGANTAEIDLIERVISGHLPTEYRNWLRESDGAYIVDMLAMPDSEGGALLEELFTAREAAANYPGMGASSCVPLDFLVVGDGPGGAICIKISGNNVGTIWFADYDLANQIFDDGERGLEIMTPLADSWTSFLRSR